MSKLSQLPYTLEEIQAEKDRRRYQRADYIFPDTGVLRRDLYKKHTEFFRLGADWRIRLLLAANRMGKSYTGLFEVMLHATGRYPKWWDGKRFHHPVKIWVCTPVATKTRNESQQVLLGQLSDYGTGFIPKSYIVPTATGSVGTGKQGIPGAIDKVTITHYTDGLSDGISELYFKSYAEGVLAFESEHVHVVLLDEEPPLEICGSCLMRTMCTNPDSTKDSAGIVMITMTPMFGMTPLIVELQERSPNCKVITGTWDDAPHLSDNEKALLWSAIPEFQRDARSKGVPRLGSGAIYPIPEEQLLVPGIEVLPHWRVIRGMDTGWNWTAAIWIAYDPDAAIYYEYAEYKVSQDKIPVHAAAINARGALIQGPCDYAGTDQSDGTRIIEQYKAHSVQCYACDKRGNEATLHYIYELMSKGQYKICTSLQSTRDEQRLYRRDEQGKIVKSNDHLMDARKYAMKVPVNEWGFYKEAFIIENKTETVRPRGVYRTNPMRTRHN